MLPKWETVEEVLTEPSEVTRWGIGLASVLVALIGGFLGWFVS